MCRKTCDSRLQSHAQENMWFKATKPCSGKHVIQGYKAMLWGQMIFLFCLSVLHSLTFWFFLKIGSYILIEFKSLRPPHLGSPLKLAPPLSGSALKLAPPLSGSALKLAPPFSGQLIRLYLFKYINWFRNQNIFRNVISILLLNVICFITLNGYIIIPLSSYEHTILL